ncbi:MAG: TVP38/TMEM64 family protein [Pseudomonadota bacterium]
MTDLTQEPPKAGILRRLLPLAVLASGIAAFFLLGLDDYVTFEALREHRELLGGFVAENSVLAVLAFLAIYGLSTALSLPGGAVLTVAGGFLFGALFGTLWVVIGATIGATGVFLAARTVLGDSLKRRAGPFLRKMEAGFQDNALSYLLVLRLIPLFPFFVVNLVPAFLGMGLRPYVLGTLIGIIPGSFVFASVGAGLGSVFDANESFTLAGVLTPEIIVALVGLSLLSLLPVVYKRLKARRETA